MTFYTTVCKPHCGVIHIGTIVIALACSAPAYADKPMIVGVGTHFAQNKSDFSTLKQWLQSAALYSTRDEMHWATVENAKGIFAWRGNAALTRGAWSMLKSTNPAFNPLLIVDYGNSRYGGGHPRSDLAVSAFSKYAAWVTSENAHLIQMVEIWNEWNIGSGSIPKVMIGVPSEYVKLAHETYTNIKAVNPKAQVIVGGMGHDLPDWLWLKEAISLGLLDYANGLSVHLYNYCDRKHVGSDELVERLRLLRELLISNGKSDLPVYISEVGWPTHTGKCAVSERDAALYSLRFLLEASARPWIAGVWFYEFMDSGDNPEEREHRFGLLRRDKTEKPSGCAVRMMGRLATKRPLQLINNNGVTLAIFDNESDNLLVAWSSANGANSDKQVDINVNEGKVYDTVKDICGLTAGEINDSSDGRHIKLRVNNLQPTVVSVSKNMTFH